MALSDNQKKFIKDASAAAKVSQKATGVPASVIVAQAVLEFKDGVKATWAAPTTTLASRRI